MDKTKINLERLRACDEWEESKHPRANNGQFTSGAGSAGGGSSKSQAANLSSLKKSGDKATKAAISILGSDIKSALAAAHSDKGFSSGMLSDAKAASYAKKLSELTGEEFYIDKVTEKGFMGMDFTKPVLKVKPASESPLRKAAKIIQGNGGGLTGYKGLSFTQKTSEADSGTPAGEVHNFIVGNLKGKEPTKENVTAACKEVVNMINNDIKYLRERAATARRYGNEQAAKEWESNLKHQQDRIQAAYEVASGLNESKKKAKSGSKVKSAAPKLGSKKFHFDVSNYKTVVSGKDANTPEGEVHNSIIGMLETDNPTKYDIANAAFYLADEDYNDKVRRCREMIRKAKAQGKSKASQEWGEVLIKANRQVALLNAIGEAMRK